MVGLAPLNRTKDFGRSEDSFAFFVVGLTIFVDVEIFLELLTTCFIILVFLVFALLLPWPTSLLLFLSLSLSLSFDSKIEWKFWLWIGEYSLHLLNFLLDISKPRFIWWEFIKSLFMWAMHVWLSGQIACFGIPFLFNKNICLFFYSRMILLILREFLKKCEILT